MEILSPASNMNHIKVAIDNNANAVYGGVKEWNARNKAINFTVEEYNFIIDELHKHNIKFFLTLNILMLDEEIEEAINFLKNNKVPDAFIVTDIGLIERLKKEFPNVPLHFSTQFGAHNIDDVNYIKSMGGERAILARELTMDEINNIREKTDIELECFIWGSQCLSFSGLCFFGTLINGGGGNRGKCIITCRDIYSVNGDYGHFLYVPDMDCINLISKLNKIDCLKLEGRRRNPKEIAKVLEMINKKMHSKINAGYLYGTSIKENKLYEKINSRIKLKMLAKEVPNISDADVCIEYINDKPNKFSRDYQNSNVKYIYTEIKKPYNVNKKNLSLEFTFKDHYVAEILYVNHKGTGHTFYDDKKNYRELSFQNLINDIESKNEDINIYKLKYIKNLDDTYYISSNLYKEVIDYLVNDCRNAVYKNIDNNLLIKQMYLETSDENIIDLYLNDSFVKIIYNIVTINDLKNIEHITKKYNDKIIYKLPLFNWKSIDLLPYLKLLSQKEVMFTRFSQLYICKNIKFKKKYCDYTIYIWNKETLAYLKNNNVTEFTASLELSYDRNKSIFGNNNMQVIIAGKLPMVYTRTCFSHLFGCLNCSKSKQNIKNITNVDKNMNFEIVCNDDYRCIFNKEPILNDYSTVILNNSTKFRYVALNQDIDIIKNTVEKFKEPNYYKKLKNDEYWKNSYQCNLYEGKE